MSLQAQALLHMIAKNITASRPERQLRELDFIVRSGLFDKNYYLAEHPQLSDSDVEPLSHFLDFGHKDGWKPNPYFDPTWYLSHNPDVVADGSNPLYHYIMHGDKEGRRPCRVFDPLWYRERFSVSPGVNALKHFLDHRRSGTVSPIPEFDIEFYRETYPDVIMAQVDPFEHFIEYGYREWRNPSAAFDTRWYVNRYLDGELSVNPFLHWLEHRNEPGVFGRLPAEEPTIPRLVRKYTQPSADFEEFKPLPPSAPRQAKIIAYYLPQFHAFEENDTWWGKGFTEWTNLPRGVPRFPGHYQPRVPRDLGFYRLDERDGTETLRQQARMARDAGIHGFAFYYYWFNGKRLMDGPLDRLLADPDIDLPFLLLWANENWTRRWDGAESEVLIRQDYNSEDDEAMVADFARHFRDPRYIRIRGRPLLMIYRPAVIPDTATRISEWRVLFRERFNEDPLIFMAQSFGDVDPRPYGMDGAIQFPPHILTQSLPSITQQTELLDQEFTGNIYTYDAIVHESLRDEVTAFPLIKTAVPSWDNDARRQGEGLVLVGSTPAKYQAWLTELVARARRSPVFGEAFVAINAWNEWCEGAYLEPDLHFGSAYLNATGRAVVGLTLSDSITHKLLLIGHDAFPSGAQHLLLNIGITLRRYHNLGIEFLLLGDGAMAPLYREIAPTTILTDPATLDPILNDFHERGFRRALLNTSVSGDVTPSLVAKGITPAVMLVHELPRLLREKGLIQHITRGFRFAEHVVFPARFVENAVVSLLSEVPRSAVIMPQGSYKTLSPLPEEIAVFRQEICVAEGQPLVLGVGYADFRKGFDQFLQVWRLLNRERVTHFCWLGQIAPELQTWLGEEIALAVATGTFHLPGLIENVAPAFGAADMLLLTSREDPFPTVVLEALSLGKPVIAFGDSGGMPEMLADTGTGYIVPYGDPVAMANAVIELLDLPEPSAEVERRKTLVHEHYMFLPYVSRLVAMALPDMPRVSVVVPNYNYARYMADRLGSIFRQTHPVHEVLVLDDRSTDDSVTVIPAVARDWNREIRLIVNEANSGSVFAQWRKAAETATGEWLWIAEADDIAAPEFLAGLIDACQGDGRVVMAFSDSATINADGSPLWPNYKEYYATIEPDGLTQSGVFEAEAFALRFLSVKNLILNASAVLWRREALLQALDACGEALRDYKVAGDWRLYLQALSIPGARIAYESKPLNVHRRHAQSVTHALDADRHVREIAQCHDFARSIWPSDGREDGYAARQEAYLKAVDDQLHSPPPTATDDE